MARKSRRKDAIPKIHTHEDSGATASPKKKLLQTGIYGRLSLKDLGQEDGDSMETQIALLRDYVLRHPDLELREVYIDNGWTGTTFQRPEFTHLIKDVQNGKINCIVVKDLSRLGRNYLEAGHYLQHVFPSLQVRFIAINDGYDSATGDPDSMVIAMKNIVNDYYSKDISRKLSAVIDSALAKGPRYAGKVPYGYQMSTTGEKHFVIDKAVAPYLHLIFRWALDGVKPFQIANYLNDMKAPTPLRYYALQHPEKGKRRSLENAKWNVGSILSILLNQVYAGDFIAHKSRCRKYEPVGIRQFPEEEWLIFPDTHEGYISNEDFAILKEMLRSNYKQKQDSIKRKYQHVRNSANPLLGLVYCGLCGKPMQLVKDGEERYAWYYTCKGHSPYSCHKVYSITYGELETQVLYNLQIQLKTAINADAFLKRCSLEESKARLKASRNASLQMLYAKQAAIISRKKQTFEDLTNHLLDKETYQMQTAKLEQEAKWLSGDIERAKQRLEDVDTYLTLDNDWLKGFLSANISQDFDSRIIHQLVDHIEVWDNCHIRIIFNYADYMEKFLRCLEELKHIDGDDAVSDSQ